MKYSSVDISRILNNSYKLDLHGYTKDEARIELFNILERIDNNKLGIDIVHGYKSGEILKTLIRKELKHCLIKDKIHLDAGRTLLVLDFKNFKK